MHDISCKLPPKDTKRHLHDLLNFFFFFFFGGGGGGRGGGGGVLTKKKKVKLVIC